MQTRKLPERPLARTITHAEVFFCETPGMECRTSINDFEIDKLRDLFVFVAWRGVSGQHTQDLRFVLPDGSLYQNSTAQFTTATMRALQPKDQVAGLSRGEPTVVSVLPVGGTLITQHSLTGTWNVEVYLDGKLVTKAPLILGRHRE